MQDYLFDMNSKENTEPIKIAYISGLEFIFGQDETILIQDKFNILSDLHNNLINSYSPKLLRATGWALGSALSKLYFELKGTDGFSGQVSMYDPKDYQRLNPETSFLKAYYDELKSAVDRGDKTLVDEFLDGLLDINTTLPPVDWSFISKIDQPQKLIRFASKQSGSKSSKTLLTLFLDLLRKVSLPLENANPFSDFVVSLDGVGKLLLLGGLGKDSKEMPTTASYQVLSILSPTIEYASNNTHNLYSVFL